MRNAGLEEAQAGIKIAGRNINNLRYADDTTLMSRQRRVIKELLDEGEKAEWKSWLKAQHPQNQDHAIRFHYFLANRREKSGSSDSSYFLGLQNYCRW